MKSHIFMREEMAGYTLGEGCKGFDYEEQVKALKIIVRYGTGKASKSNPLSFPISQSQTANGT